MYATSKQGRRQRFGMLTVLPNNRSTKVLWKLEDDLPICGGRRPYVEEDIPWKKTFRGRQPSMQGELWWQATFGGRRTSLEDDLQWKMTTRNRICLHGKCMRHCARRHTCAEKPTFLSKEYKTSIVI